MSIRRTADDFTPYPGMSVFLRGYRNAGEVAFVGQTEVLVNDGADWPTPTPPALGCYTVRDPKTLLAIQPIQRSTDTPIECLLEDLREHFDNYADGAPDAPSYAKDAGLLLERVERMQSQVQRQLDALAVDAMEGR